MSEVFKWEGVDLLKLLLLIMIIKLIIIRCHKLLLILSVFGKMLILIILSLVRLMKQNRITNERFEMLF